MQLTTLDPDNQDEYIYTYIADWCPLRPALLAFVGASTVYTNNHLYIYIYKCVSERVSDENPYNPADLFP